MTSNVYSGNLGGLAGADAKCQTLAVAASLGGTFKAWLSDGVTSAAARMTGANVPYTRVDGVVVASDWTAFLSGTHQNAIVKTEANGPLATGTATCSGSGAWTGTLENGAMSPVGLHCNGWSSTVGMGVLGAPLATSYQWSHFCWGTTIDCAHTAPLYCVQQ